MSYRLTESNPENRVLSGLATIQELPTPGPCCDCRYLFIDNGSISHLLHMEGRIKGVRFAIEILARPAKNPLDQRLVRVYSLNWLDEGQAAS